MCFADVDARVCSFFDHRPAFGWFLLMLEDKSSILYLPDYADYAFSERLDIQAAITC